MIPLHKKVKIAAIQKYFPQDRLIVVSTQVLEAGVNVSFEHGVRAFSILPAYVQSGGRINRHMEHPDGYGILTLVPFYRRGEKETRWFIYESQLTKITDELLSAKEEWTEQELEELVRHYYERMFRENPRETGKLAIRQAACGYWTSLSQYEPFRRDNMRLPVFVPWVCPENERTLLPQPFLDLQAKFGMSSPESIYTCMMDRTYWKNKSFSERKQFMMLAQYHVLNVPIKAAMAWKDEYLQCRIPYLKHDVYDQDIGFTAHFEGRNQLI